ncbi:hypothetical protein CFB84_17160 [Burkholderia aenigmatica]|uniref:Uncharacterized protein n=1 Tax=Burkholderia aenigmatica TaxID=2015348 RepID=A0A228IWL0_9BURK|nr:hypothetical protein CFB84_17160 [Burkholderia aenigmatica]
MPRKAFALLRPERFAVNQDKCRMTSKARSIFVRPHLYNALSPDPGATPIPGGTRTLDLPTMASFMLSMLVNRQLRRTRWNSKSRT